MLRIAQLAGDLQIADGEEDQKSIRGIDFPTNAFYLQNRAIIDAVIAEPWTSMSAAQQDFYTNNKAFMTRALAKEQVPANDNRLPTVALAC